MTNISEWRVYRHGADWFYEPPGYAGPGPYSEPMSSFAAAWNMVCAEIACQAEAACDRPCDEIWFQPWAAPWAARCQGSGGWPCVMWRSALCPTCAHHARTPCEVTIKKGVVHICRPDYCTNRQNPYGPSPVTARVSCVTL
jgi:hypothetical protein